MIAHSDTEDAAPTRKRTYGHHPLMGFVDHGPGGTGEPLAAPLRPGNTGSNTDADHITATQLALAQLPKREPRGRQTLMRTDSAGSTHDLVARLAQPGRWPSYSVSVGMVITQSSSTCWRFRYRPVDQPSRRTARSVAVPGSLNPPALSWTAGPRACG